jgi:hypothetical protein
MKKYPSGQIVMDCCGGFLREKDADVSCRRGAVQPGFREQPVIKTFPVTF